MSNLATKAPNFTPENASAYGRKGALARKASIQREKELLAQALIQNAMSEKPAPDEARRQRVLFQIDSYLDDMKGKSLKTRLLIGKAVAELWKLVQPTAGVAKPARNRVFQPREPTEMTAADPSQNPV